MSESSSTTPAGYEAMIGLEVHAQLATESKMFCGCDASYSGAPPNSHVCAVDLGLPGSLPVINERALDQAVMAALALECEIAPITKFDRKNYPYPDIPKGYQISQYDTPLGHDGHVDVELPSGAKRVGIIRTHLEEDTGKTIHAILDGRDVSLVDYNRSGVPLLEIVSHADMTTPEEARLYFSTLREILVYLGVSSGDLQEGAMRADVNVSIRRPGAEPGVKVEIKNLNSFRSVQRALEYEIGRQAGVLDGGGTLAQETRGWDEDREVTVAQRSKEFAEDYRYFPEPDLPPLTLTPERVEALRAAMPELASAARARLTSRYGLSTYDAQVLSQDVGLVRLMDDTLTESPAADPKKVANWLTGEFLRLLNESGKSVVESAIDAKGLAGLIGLVDRGTITTSIGKTVFAEMFTTGESPDAIVAQRGLQQVSDRDELEETVREVLDQNPSLCADYVTKEGKTEGPLVGKVMAATRGKANAGLVKQIIAELLLPKG